MHIHAYLPPHACESHRMSFETWLSPSIIWIPGIKLKMSGFATDVFITPRHLAGSQINNP